MKYLYWLHDHIIVLFTAMRATFGEPRVYIINAVWSFSFLATSICGLSDDKMFWTLFEPIFSAVHLWSDPLRQMVIPGLNVASYSVPLTVTVATSFPLPFWWNVCYICTSILCITNEPTFGRLH